MSEPAKEKAPPRCQPGTGNEETNHSEVITARPDDKAPFIPELLDVLEDARLVIEAVIDLNGLSDTGTLGTTARKIREAIAKARGKEAS
jgi:hypothetical protein